MRDAPKTEAAVRIIDAATELFLDKGYDNTTLSEVARRAHVAKGLVSHHFGSKPRLLARVLEAYYDRQRAALAVVPSDKPARERLRLLLDAYFVFASEHRRFPRLIQRISQSSPEAHELVREQLGGMYRYVEAQLLEITKPTGRLSARQCYVTFSGLVINYFLYADALASVWGDDPYSDAMLQERRDHLLVVAEAVFDAIDKEP